MDIAMGLAISRDVMTEKGIIRVLPFAVMCAVYMLVVHLDSQIFEGVRARGGCSSRFVGSGS